MHYMLENNTVSDIIKARPVVLQNLRHKAHQGLCISAIAHAEIMYGLARKPQAKILAKATHSFLRRVNVIDFNAQASHDHGQFRRSMELSGKNLQPMDLLIASHAHSTGAVLVTADKAFAQIEGLRVEDWTV